MLFLWWPALTHSVSSHFSRGYAIRFRLYSLSVAHTLRVHLSLLVSFSPFLLIFSSIQSDIFQIISNYSLMIYDRSGVGWEWEVTCTQAIFYVFRWFCLESFDFQYDFLKVCYYSLYFFFSDLFHFVWSCLYCLNMDGIALYGLECGDWFTFDAWCHSFV